MTLTGTSQRARVVCSSITKPLAMRFICLNIIDAKHISLDTKAGRFFYSQQKFLVQNLERAVWRQVKPIKTSVRARQASRLTPFLNAKLSRSVATSQCLKTLVRYARGARYKLEESQPLVIVKFLLYHYPKPLYN